MQAQAAGRQQRPLGGVSGAATASMMASRWVGSAPTAATAARASSSEAAWTRVETVLESSGSKGSGGGLRGRGVEDERLQEKSGNDEHEGLEEARTERSHEDLHLH